MLQRQKGDYDDAIQSLDKARKIRQAALPPSHPDLAATLEIYASVLRAMTPPQADRAAEMEAPPGKSRQPRRGRPAEMSRPPGATGFASAFPRVAPTSTGKAGRPAFLPQSPFGRRGGRVVDIGFQVHPFPLLRRENRQHLLRRFEHRAGGPLPRGPESLVHGGLLSLAQSHPLLLKRVLQDLGNLIAEVKVLQGRHLRGVNRASICLATALVRASYSE